MRVMPIELGRLDQAHQRRRTFAAAQRYCKEPIFASKSPWLDLLLDVVIIDRHDAVIHHRLWRRVQEGVLAGRLVRQLKLAEDSR